MAMTAMAMCAQGAGLAVSGIRGEFRAGQVFLTWREAHLAGDVRLSVHCSAKPIVSTADVKSAQLLAKGIRPGSARDWWQDPASFEKGTPNDPPAGFVIRTGQAPLDPSGGLFVHTVTARTVGPQYYAVTVADAGTGEGTTLTPGANTLGAPVTGRVEQSLPVWQGKGQLPARGSCEGRPLRLVLHGRGGGATAGKRHSVTNCLWFGDADQGWRASLAFKFRLTVSKDMITVTPLDRVWIGRAVTESRDARDHCPAINTWWYGYHSGITETTDTPEAVVPNYTERYLLALVKWAQNYLGTDPNQTYITGGSMGGSGTVAMVMHFPEVFAAAYANVPVYSCTRPGTGSAWRIECMIGTLKDRKVVTDDGIPVLDYMNGERNMLNATVATPPIFACNGRKDGSIPWENNPPFYAAAAKARQAFAVYWNNGQHGMRRECPSDALKWGSIIYKYRLNESYPVFTNCSDDKDYGNGDAKDGDLIGWINRGLGWANLKDTADEYALTVTAAHPDMVYPVTVDVTPRRLQRFAAKPGETLSVRVGDAAPVAVKVDEQRLFTISGVRVADAAGTRIRVIR